MGNKSFDNTHSPEKTAKKDIEIENSDEANIEI